MTQEEMFEISDEIMKLVAELHAKGYSAKDLGKIMVTLGDCILKYGIPRTMQRGTN